MSPKCKHPHGSIQQCSRCDFVGEFSETNFAKSGRDHLMSHCKACAKLSQKHARRRHIYGIEPEDYQKLQDKSKGACTICGKNAAATTNGLLVIDHCHSTLKVRGLLCDSCNRGLGMFQDNPQFLRNAANYLDELD